MSTSEIFAALFLLWLVSLPVVIPLAFRAGRQKPTPKRSTTAQAAVSRTRTAVDRAVANQRAYEQQCAHEGCTAEPAEVLLDCRECGRRAVPPADSVTRPIPIGEAGLVALGDSGYVVTASCSACNSPLTSRTMTGQEAQWMRDLGMRPAAPVADQVENWLSAL